MAKKPPPFPPKKSKVADMAMPSQPFPKKKGGPPMPMMNKGGAVKKK